MSDFDIEGARKAGYGDAEIADFLGKQSNFDVGSARKAGYGDTDIIGHLTKSVAPKTVSAAMSVNNPPLKQPSAPGAATAEPPDRSWGDTAKSFITNLAPDAVHTIPQMVQAIPQIPAAIGELATGLRSKAQAPIDQAVNYLHRQFDPDTAGKVAEVRATQRAANEGGVNALAENLDQSYGSIPRVKETLATRPFQAWLDATGALTGAGSALKMGPRATLLPQIGEAMTTVGRAADPMIATTNALAYGANKAGGLASNVIGGTTGAGGRPYRDAADAGKQSVVGGTEGQAKAAAYQENARGAPPDNVVARAKGALAEVRADAGKEYRSGMVDLSKDRTVLDFQDINKALDKADEVAAFKGARLDPAAKDVNTRLQGIIKDWETLNPKAEIFKDVKPGELTAANFHTPEGLDALKRTIGNIRSSTMPRTPERVAADRVYNAVKGEIVAQAPAYAGIMEGYEKAANKIGEATRTLSLGEKATGDTAARKLVSATRNNVQTNYGGRQKLIDVLAEKDSTLPYAIAGQATNSLAPRGLVGRGGLMALGGSMVANPMNALAAPFFSPRLMGEGAYYGGKAAGVAEKAVDGLNALGVNSTTLRSGEQASSVAARTDSDNLGTMARAFRKAVEKRNAFGGGISPTMMSE